LGRSWNWSRFSWFWWFRFGCGLLWLRFAGLWFGRLRKSDSKNIIIIVVPSSIKIVIPSSIIIVIPSSIIVVSKIETERIEAAESAFGWSWNGGISDWSCGLSLVQGVAGFLNVLDVLQKFDRANFLELWFEAGVIFHDILENVDWGCTFLDLLGDFFQVGEFGLDFLDDVFDSTLGFGLDVEGLEEAIEFLLQFTDDLAEDFLDVAFGDGCGWCGWLGFQVEFFKKAFEFLLDFANDLAEDVLDSALGNGWGISGWLFNTDKLKKVVQFLLQFTDDLAEDIFQSTLGNGNCGFGLEVQNLEKTVQFFL